jgi:hypothetical protein
MDELLELRRCIEEAARLGWEASDPKAAAAQYDKALTIVGELEEMYKEDKLNKIYSYAVILLIHLIKQAVKGRTTRSWDVSIANSVREINRVNKRRKSGGHYASSVELLEIINEAMPAAIDRASLDVREGLHCSEDLALLFDHQRVIDRAFEFINKVSSHKTKRSRSQQIP